MKFVFFLAFNLFYFACSAGFAQSFLELNKICSGARDYLGCIKSFSVDALGDLTLVAFQRPNGYVSFFDPLLIEAIDPGPRNSFFMFYYALLAPTATEITLSGHGTKHLPTGPDVAPGEIVINADYAASYLYSSLDRAPRFNVVSVDCLSNRFRLNGSDWRPRELYAGMSKPFFLQEIDYVMSNYCSQLFSLANRLNRISAGRSNVVNCIFC